jgi:hypothetical protein
MTTINELIERSMEKDAKAKDVFVSPKLLGYSVNGQLITGNEFYNFTNWGKSQLCHKLAIPTTYMDRCPEELQGENINYWLKNSKYEEKNWMLRTVEEDGKKYVRSVLTDKYSIFDNTDVLKMVENVVGDQKYEIKRFSADETFDGFHLRLTLPEISYNAGKTMDGKVDELTFGLHIMNSEVGKRSISITPYIHRLICENGLQVVEAKGDRFMQRHMGVQKEDMPLKVAQAFERAIAQGEQQMAKFVDTKNMKVTDPMKSINDLLKRVKGLTLPKDFNVEIQECFEIERIEKNVATVYDLVNSFTRAAQLLDNDDKRVALERFAYLELVA